MWFALQADIALAMELPEPADPEITRMEFDMKDQLVRQTIMTTQEDVTELKEDLNRIEEKIDKLKDCQITWHFIGPIQANKTKLLAENFDWIQSVDRAKIAHRLNNQRPIEKKPLNVCIQVKISDEPSKSGISMSQLRPLCALVDSLPQLQLRGLMAIPAPNTDFMAQQSAYEPLKKTFTQLKTEFLTLDTFSIGMSGDFEAAIAQNSTLVRIGTSLFGKRSDSV